MRCHNDKLTWRWLHLICWENPDLPSQRWSSRGWRPWPTGPVPARVHRKCEVNTCSGGRNDYSWQTWKTLNLFHLWNTISFYCVYQTYGCSLWEQQILEADWFYALKIIFYWVVLSAAVKDILQSWMKNAKYTVNNDYIWKIIRELMEWSCWHDGWGVLCLLMQPSCKLRLLRILKFNMYD